MDGGLSGGEDTLWLHNFHILVEYCWMDIVLNKVDDKCSADAENERLNTCLSYVLSLNSG